MKQCCPRRHLRTFDHLQDATQRRRKGAYSISGNEGFYDAVIVGGGPAGIIGAVTVAHLGCMELICYFVATRP